MTVRLIKRAPRYSPAVKQRLDLNRPKYNEAVKSLAAFAPDERKFSVLVSHLDAACTEARGRYIAVKPGTYMRINNP
jgi:hypothetical protein